MPEFKPFEFTDEFLEKLRDIKEIPVHFYNKDGQILIYRKENASAKEIDRLVRFRNQGIYYSTEDADKLSTLPGPVEQEPGPEIPEGLTNTKLISEKHTDQLASGTKSVFEQIKSTSLNATHTRMAGDRLESLFEDFVDREDAMTGLVNILEIMKERNADFDVELAVKRTVVAMALKTRGMHATAKFKDKQKIRHAIKNLMMSALLCDIGCFQMRMPRTIGLSTDEMSYVQKHPFLSYLMVAHEDSLDEQVKHNLLTHHRPRYDDRHDNNYPNKKNLTTRLAELGAEFQKHPSKRRIAEDIRKQLELFRVNRMYDEDANILAISSEFASLTSDVPWRKALSAEQAVKMIINNSFFTYTGRIMHEFLDYVAISLCDNRKILKEGDFIVVASDAHDGTTVFEACQIEQIGRFQSRPGVRRIGTLRPLFAKAPKLSLNGFEEKSLRIDRRRAHFELTQDGTRRIVYFVDPTRHSALHAALTRALSRGAITN